MTDITPNKKTLLIPDTHQDIHFANKCLEKESDFDHVVFMGDEFDSFDFDLTLEDTVNWINDKYVELGDKATWLVGNHNIPYLEDIIKGYDRKYYICSGYAREKSKYICDNINRDWFNNLKLCCKVGDYYISHAGFHTNHFRPYLSPEDNIKELYNEWEKNKSTFCHNPDHWIWDVGQCRGGYSIIGSPIWLDWKLEFQPIDGLCQIVGHTTSRAGHREYHLPELLSYNYCLDGMQSCYGVLQNNNLEVKYTK